MSGDQRTRSVKRTFGAFKNIRVMICAAIFVGMSILLGKYLPIFNIDILRFSFENLPIILSGILFGPAVGAVVGILQYDVFRYGRSYHRYLSHIF